MLVELAQKGLAIPLKNKCVRVEVGRREARLTDGTYVSVPKHAIYVAERFAIYKDGTPAVDLTHRDAVASIKAYNHAHGLAGDDALVLPFLLEDEDVRDQLGREHRAFDENFGRHNEAYRSGYINDSTRYHPALNPVEGINQMLVHRVLYWEMSDGPTEIGPILIASDGVIPRLTKKQLERLKGAKGLRLLGKLRGMDIDEKDNEVVDVRDALGYAKFTLPHEYHDESGKLIQHECHIYAPPQEMPEAVGIRYVDWDRHIGLWCFYVGLDAGAGSSYPGRSFPLVRGGVKVALTKHVKRC